MNKTNNARQGGFTLISLLITLGVIAIMMAIGGPALWEIAYEIKLRNTARETVSGMRAARYRAINETREFGFLADPTTQVLNVFVGTDPTDAASVIGQVPLPGGVSIALSDFGTASDAFVIFNPDGSTGNPGTIVFSNANNHSITVTVGPASTGRMHIGEVVAP